MDCTATFPSAMEINQVPVTILNNALVGKTVNQNTKSHSDSLVILNVGFKKKKKKKGRREKLQIAQSFWFVIGGVCGTV